MLIVISTAIKECKGNIADTYENQWFMRKMDLIIKNDLKIFRMHFKTKIFKNLSLNL